MQYLIIFIAIVVFVGLWTTIINKFLPSAVVSGGRKERKYDERQAMIFTEVLARTCIWLVYSLLWNLLMKALGVIEMNETIFVDYIEIVYLVIAVIWAIISYFAVKKKYTPKRDSYE